MLVRLRHKPANVLDGVDVSAHHVGDMLTLTAVEAELLIAEGWAELPMPDEPTDGTRASALHDGRPYAELGDGDEHHGRRVEDRIREAHHDAHAVVLHAKNWLE